MMWLLLWMLACHGEPAPAAPVAAAAAPSSATTPVVSRRPTGTIVLPAELQPWQRVELRARLPAFVAERRVDVGDRVQRGEVLVRLSAPERAAERLEVEAELSASRRHLGRLEQAGGTEGAVAPAEVEALRGVIEATEARLRALRELEAELVVKAPFDGVVTARGVDTGALVGRSGDPAMLTLAEVARLRVTVDVPEPWVEAATVGREITLVVAGRPRTIAVARTAGALEARSRTLRVELDVDNADGALLPGRHVELAWPLDQGQALWFVPATAVVRTTEGTWVWAVREGLLLRVDVKELMREKAEVAVGGELVEGEQVVTRGSEDMVGGGAPR